MFFVKQGIFSYQNWGGGNQGNSFQVLNLVKQNKTNQQQTIEKFLLFKWSKLYAYMHMQAWVMNTPNYKYNPLVPAGNTKLAYFYGPQILISIKSTTL